MNSNHCQICGEKKSIKIEKNDFFLRTDSRDKELINYKNLICVNCGNIYHQPKIDKKKLIKHYQTKYRYSDAKINLGKNIIDLPINFKWISMSFHRFYAFYKIIKNKNIIKSNKKLKILDYGCYHGAFLYACKKVFNFNTIGTDYNKTGLNIAKSAFLVDEVFETKENFFSKKINADIVSLLQVLEHLPDPVKFLIRIKKNILKKNGLVYIEIPNPFANPLDDPTHLNLYSYETIKYILESCNYKVLHIEQRGIYKRNLVLRDRNNLNIHVLARSLSNKKNKFNKIMIGKKIYNKMLSERKATGFKIFLEQTKIAFKQIMKMIETFIYLILNLFFPNLTIKISSKLKNK